MSMGTTFSIAKLVYSGAKAVASGTLGSLFSVATGTVSMAKHYVDAENNKLLDLVQKSEGCAYIELVECTFGVPSAYAVSHVHEKGGISWRRPDKDSALVFWHPDDTFRPAIGADPLVRNPKTNLVGKPSHSGPSNVCQNTENCCRRPRV